MNDDTTPRPPAAPDLQLLSNGRYAVMVSSAGGGSSRRGDVAVTRWRDDATRDAAGAFCYVRDADSGRVWSTTYQPTLRRADAVDVVFAPGRATFTRRDGDITLETTVAVAPADDVELRRVRIRSHAAADRALTLTSYAEVVLGSAASDADHPAFEKLFVQTEIDAGTRTVLCTRRPQTADKPRTWMFHAVVADGVSDDTAPGAVSFETDRARFIGRGRSAAHPRALESDAPLSGTTGAVLDPVVAARCGVRLEAGATKTVTFVTGAADTRDACLALAAKFRQPQAIDAAIEEAATAARKALDDAQSTAGRRAHPRAPRRSDAVRQRRAARRRRRAAAQPPRPAGAVGARDFGRPADRVRPHRRREESRSGRVAVEGAYLVAVARRGDRPRDRR